jgi:ATP-dependent DNA ligase
MTAIGFASNAMAIVRLITCGGRDWTKRFPWIVEAALKKLPQAGRDR